MPSEGPKKGRKCYLTSAFSGIPNAKRGEQKPGSGPQQRGTKSDVATSPLPPKGPKEGGNAMPAPAFSGVPQRQAGE